MKLPRDISSGELLQRLKPLGYKATRQTGSHIRLTTEIGGQHHVTIPAHDPIKVGTLSAITGDIAQHFRKSKEEIVRMLF